MHDSIKVKYSISGFRKNSFTGHSLGIHVSYTFIEFAFNNG